MSGSDEQGTALPWSKPELDSDSWLIDPDPHDAVISVVHFHARTIDMLLAAPGRARFWLRLTGIVVCCLDSVYLSNAVDGIGAAPFASVSPGEIRESTPRLSHQDPTWRQRVTDRSRWVVFDAILGARGVIVCESVDFRPEPRESLHLELRS